MSNDRAPGQHPRGVSIVVPTYREAGNVAALVSRTAATMADQTQPWELVITDDQSDDATVQEARHSGAGLPVRVVVRKHGPRELAANVMHGIEHARYATLVVMDGDLSHRPEEIPTLLDALNGDTDMAIGSRYLRNAEIDPQWSAPRRWGSRGATLAARALWPVSDPLSGFFAVRREAIPPPETMDPIGYKIALEIGVRGRMRTAEVPIRFEKRHAGESKMDAREVVRFARHLVQLARARYPETARTVTFGCVGLSGFVVDVAFYVALGAAGADHRVARAVSFWPAATWNWALNRWVTFGDRPRARRSTQWARAVTASIASAGVNVGAYIAMTGASTWLDAHRLAALALGVALGAGVNFGLAHAWVFRSAQAHR